MDTPLVSVAMCTYNGEKFLNEQLSSIRNQSYKNLEIVVVDDGSVDETLSILSSHAQDDNRIKIYQNEVNLGYIKNFEKAISLCSGEYIALSDQDDVWNLNKIKLQVENIGENLLIYHDSEFVDDNNLSLNLRMSDLMNMYKGGDYKPFLFFNCVSGHSCLFKKSFKETCLPFPDNTYHDKWLALTACSAGTIAYLPDLLVKYRQHDGTGTNILKLKRGSMKAPVPGRIKISKDLEELEAFAARHQNKNDEFISSLIILYRRRLHSYFSASLVIFMYRHYKQLLSIPRKSLFSRLSFVFKHIWGVKLKT